MIEATIFWKGFARNADGALGEEVVDDVSVDVGEAKIAAGVVKGEAFVVEA